MAKKKIMQGMQTEINKDEQGRMKDIGAGVDDILTELFSSSYEVLDAAKRKKFLEEHPLAELGEGLEKLAEKSHELSNTNYVRILSNACSLFQEKTGFVFTVLPVMNKDFYEAYKEGVLKFKQELFKPGAKVNKLDEVIPFEEHVMTVLEPEKTVYKSGLSAEKIPAGVVGTLNHDRDFCPVRADFYISFKAGDLQRVELVPDTVMPVIKKRAEVINGEGYRWTQTGSWGYVVGEIEDEYSIEFHEVTAAEKNKLYGKLPFVWSVKKEHVVVKEEKDPEFEAKKARFQKKSKRLGLEQALKDSFAEAESVLAGAEEELYSKIKNAAEALGNAGINPGLVKCVLEKYLGRNSKQVAGLVSEGILPEKSAFDRLAELMNKSNYGNAARKALDMIAEKTGLFFAAEKISSEKDYDDFMSRVAALKVRGYKIRDGPAEQPVELEAGSAILLRDLPEDVMKELEKYISPNTVLFVPQVCAPQKHYHISFPGKLVTGIVGDEAKPIILSEAHVLEKDHLQKGSEVRIKKDSQLYNPAIKTGLLLDDPGSMGTAPDGSLIVRAEFKVNRDYTPKIMDWDMNAGQNKVVGACTVTDVELVKKELEGEELRQYNKELKARDKLRDSVGLNIKLMFSLTRAEYAFEIGESHGLSQAIIDVSRQLGLKDRSIHRSFQEALQQDCDYLLGKKMLDLEK